MAQMNEIDIMKLLDEQGRLVSLPEDRIPGQAVLSWLLHFYEHGRFYSENEVGDILADCCTDDNCALLQRELVGSGLLSRSNDPLRYWRSDFLKGEIDCGDVLLRDMHDDDEATLLSIHESLGYYDDITGEKYSAEDAQAMIKKTDVPPGGHSEFYIAKMILTPEKRPTGYLMLYEGFPQKDTLWIGALFLSREFHHNGIGRKVIQTVEKLASISGFDQAGIGVYAQNTQGLQFWIKQGYRNIDKLSVNADQRAILGLSKRLRT